jgi:alpha-D-ribose 1-methylphosphonate 5-triphosphate synthase subunit PhnG
VKDKSVIFDQSAALSLTSSASPDSVKAMAETLLAALEDSDTPLEVLKNRTGLVMLPYRDTVHGSLFHVGEALIAEARVRHGAHEGYGACLGRDLECALGMAIVDLAFQSGLLRDEVQAFLERAAREQQAQQSALFAGVEATRVQMETF